MAQLLIELLGALVRAGLFYLLALPILLLIATPVIFIKAIYEKRPYWRSVFKLYRGCVRAAFEFFPVPDV